MFLRVGPTDYLPWIHVLVGGRLPFCDAVNVAYEGREELRYRWANIRTGQQGYITLSSLEVCKFTYLDL